MGKNDQPILGENALRTLRARYLRKDASGELLETPHELFERVARCVAGAEAAYGASGGGVKKIQKIFFDFMVRGEFLPNSPTLMNADRRLGMLSACFVLPVEDSIDGI
ncbi:unnamed protein product, partial [marine sediment metagenome]